MVEKYWAEPSGRVQDGSYSHEPIMVMASDYDALAAEHDDLVCRLNLAHMVRIRELQAGLRNAEQALMSNAPTFALGHVRLALYGPDGSAPETPVYPPSFKGWMTESCENCGKSKSEHPGLDVWCPKETEAKHD